MLLLAHPTVLAVDGFVVGERVAGVWRAAPSPATGPDYDSKGPVWARRAPVAFRPIGVGTVGASGKPLAFEFIDEGYAGAYLRPDPKDGVLLSGGAPKAPRKVTELPKSNLVYRSFLGGFLKRNGLAGATPRITRLVRADLDGDGSDEILIEARSRDGLPTSAYDKAHPEREYSVLLVRSARGGKVTETALSFSRGKKGDGGENAQMNGILPLAEVRLRAVADLDGDGRMEVVTSARMYEAVGYDLWAFRGGRATRPLTNGTGI